jgi:hypothetical protein
MTRKGSTPRSAFRPRKKSDVQQLTSDLFVLFCQAHGLGKPEREVVFSPDRKYRADYCWPEAKVIVECDGGIWQKSGHSSGKGILRDMHKANHAQLLGFRYLRYTPQQLTTPSTLADLKQALGV